MRGSVRSTPHSETRSIHAFITGLCVASVLLFSLPSLGAQAARPTLRIAAAADLQPLLPDVLRAFEQATGIHAEATYESSATLTQQIFNGAPFDLFLAADTSFPQRLIDKGLARESKPLVYARGTLVLWARKDAPVLHGLPLSFAVLRNPALSSVAIANPRNAPYGRAAQAAIESMHLTSTLTPKLRVAANIAQAAQYADSGNAEVGFLSLTSASTARLEADGTFLRVPPETYPPILQGAVVLRHAQNGSGAARLLDYLRTPAIGSTLRQKGLMPPP